MENKNQITDGLKDIKTSFEKNTVKANLILALEEIKTICLKNKYVVEGSIDKIIADISLEESTLTSRKKLAKKVYYFMKKKSRKTISGLLYFVRKRFLTDEHKVTVKPSLLEQEIITLRKAYKKSLAELTVLRTDLKAKKVEFNTINGSYEN